jgi:putative ABC transport system permease protein
MSSVPGFLLWLLDRCCPESRPDLKGDFLELYEDRCIQMSRSHANRKLLFDTLSIIPLNFIIEQQQVKPANMFRTNIKIAKRNLLKNYAYTAINIVGLSVSLTICILIALFINDEISYDKHFPDGENIYRIAGNYSQGGPDRVASAQTSWLLKPIIEKDVQGVEAMARIELMRDLVTIDGDKQYNEPNIVLADSTFFDVFGLPLTRGNVETALDGPNNVVINKLLALKYFNTEDALGKLIRIRDKDFTVTGVMEPLPVNSHFHVAMILPISGIKQWYEGWITTNFSGTSVYTYIRTISNLKPENFESTVNSLIGKRWKGDSAPKFFLQRATSIHLESSLRYEIESNGNIVTVYLFGATAFVILILACINYINLTTAASFQRSKEVGMKKVLGSTTRMQLAQFQTESFIVTFISMIIAIIATMLIMPAFNDLSGKSLSFNPLTDPLVPVIAGLAIVITLVAGSFPPLVLLRSSAIGILQDKLELKGRKSYWRSGLIVFQFSICVVLIASTWIVTDQINYIRKADLGIDPEQVVLIPLSSPANAKKYELVKTELLRSPGVISVSASSNKVTEAIGSWRGYKPDPTKDEVFVPSIAITVDFFESLNATMAEGRSFSEKFASDVTEGYILNESAVKFMGLDQPVGHKLTGATFTGSTWYKRDGTVIGVVKDFHFASLHNKIVPTVFYLASDLTENVFWLQVRIASNDMSSTVAGLKESWSKVVDDRPFEFEFMDESVAQHYAAEERFLKIFTTFSALSIMLGALGLFGLTAFMAQRRTKEIGIRRVMGASTGILIKLMSSDFLKLVLIANVIGWPVAWYMMNNWLKSFAYQVSISAWVFVGTGVVVVLIAFTSILYHVVKASHVNPIKSIRNQ